MLFYEGAEGTFYPTSCVNWDGFVVNDGVKVEGVYPDNKGAFKPKDNVGGGAKADIEGGIKARYASPDIGGGANLDNGGGIKPDV